MSDYSKKTFGKFIQFIFLRGFLFIFQVMPFTMRRAVLSRLAGLLKLSSSLRSRVYENLRHAFPEKDETWLNKMTRQHFRYLGIFMAETLQLPRYTDSFIEKWSVFKPSRTDLEQKVANGGVFIAGHLGNWEWMSSIAAYLLGRRGNILVKRQSNPWADAFIQKARQKARLNILYTDQNPKRILKLLKEQGLIGFGADQRAGGGSPAFPFMGRMARTFKGPAYFARVSKAPCYFICCYHNEKKQLVYEIEPIPEPRADRKKEAEDWERDFTYSWVKILEKKVFEHPEDYFWIHKRWRDRPDDIEALWSYWHSYEKERGLPLSVRHE